MKSPVERPLQHLVQIEKELENLSKVKPDSIAAVERSLAGFIKENRDVILDLNKEMITPPPVENFLKAFTNAQHQTATKCLIVAERLEAFAKDLRNRAAILNNQGTQIPDDVKAATHYELETRDLAFRLGLVEGKK